MIDVIKVHQLDRILQDPDDLRHASLRAFIQKAPAALVLDASTGRRFTARVVGQQIDLAPCAES